MSRFSSKCFLLMVVLAAHTSSHVATFDCKHLSHYAIAGSQTHQYKHCRPAGDSYGCKRHQKNRVVGLQVVCAALCANICVCMCLCRTHKLQVMRVESTDGKKQEIGLYLDPVTAVKVLEKVRSLQPYKPWQFKTGESSCLILLHQFGLQC